MKRLALALTLFATPAFADQQSDLQMQRNNFMTAFAQCDSSSIAMQQEIAALKKQLEDLKPKAEPKKD